MANKVALSVLLSLSLASCMLGTKAPELAALMKAAPAMFETAPISGSVPSQEWPLAVRDLDAKQVYVRPEGLYVVTSTFFVEENGLFVPRSSMFRPQPGSDPEYTLIVEGLYSYKLKG